MPDGESSFRKKYSFTSDEFKKMQSLLSAMQTIISSTESLPIKTRTRLLEKLEEIILQFDTSIQNLDVFWSFIGRSEIAFRVYGRNKIPDALKEMLRIIWLVQCRVEGRSPDSLPPISL